MIYAPYVDRVNTELNNTIIKNKNKIKTASAFKNFIKKGCQAFTNIMRLVSLTQPTHPILEVMKTLPFYYPFNPSYYPEYYEPLDKLSRNELIAIVDHYNLDVCTDSANNLIPLIKEMIDLGTTGQAYLKRMIKSYIHFIEWAVPERHNDAKQLRDFYHNRQELQGKINIIEQRIKTLNDENALLNKKIIINNKHIVNFNDKCETKKRKLTLLN